MKKVATFGCYNYYMGESKEGVFYNIVPFYQDKPKAGYYSKKYILTIKILPDLFPHNKINV